MSSAKDSGHSLGEAHRASADLLGSARSCWGADELADMWRHQLDAQLDLGPPPSTVAEPPFASVTLRDLIEHPQPDLRLLTALKEFARAHALHPDSGLPRDLATALYYVAIASALVRRQQRITTLATEPLRDGLTSTSRFDWLDPSTRRLLAGAASLLAAPRGPAR